MFRRRHHVLFAGLALAMLAAVAVAQVPCRPVDRDEGFWLYTSWRQAEGDLPYRDYALPHLPAGPLYYAAAIKALGPDLYRVRTLNVFLILVGTALLGAAAAKRFGAAAGIFTAALYLSSSLALTWLVPIKAYAPATFALAAAAALAVWPAAGGGPRLVRYYGVGVLIGVAAAARLTLLPVLVAAVAGAWVAVPPGRRWRATLAICLGFLTVMPILAYFRVAAGEAFSFNVVGVHRLLINETPTGRFAALRDLFLPPDAALLIVISLATLATAARRGLAYPLLAAGAVVAANLAPGTSQLQYFTPAVPMLALCAGVAFSLLYQRRRAVAVALVTVMCVVGAARPAAKALGNRAHKELVGPAEVYAAVALLEGSTRPGDTLFTAWPGYAVLARREVMPGWELGYFTHRLGLLVDANARRRYHLMTYAETADALAAGNATVVLDGIDTPDALHPVLERHFTRAGTAHGVTVWRYRRAGVDVRGIHASP